MNYEKLNWDSEFFQFNVCRLTSPILNPEQLEEIDSLMTTNDFKLAYYASQDPLNPKILESEALDIKLVDKKTTYAKSINPNLEMHPAIVTYPGSVPEQKLLDLAIQSGIYSRYHVDKHIATQKFEEMYCVWMIKSTQKVMAKEVLVQRKNDEIAGFVTLAEKGDRANIGLIAVDPVRRQQGIGKTLLTTAESWFATAGYASINVITQGDNIPACKLYESCGYTIESVEYFYHIWKK